MAAVNLKEVLDGIEQQLIMGAELRATGAIPEQLHLAMLEGILGWPGDSKLPKLPSGKHITLLKRLTQWKEDELIPPIAHAYLSAAVISACTPAAVVSTVAGTQLAGLGQGPSAPQEPKPPDAKKTRALAPGEQTLFTCLPTAKKTRTRHEELLKQRLAAGRGEDYQPVLDDMATFGSESKRQRQLDDQGNHSAKSYPCARCTKTFTTELGLLNHEHWHRDSVT